MLTETLQQCTDLQPVRILQQLINTQDRPKEKWHSGRTNLTATGQFNSNISPCKGLLHVEPITKMLKDWFSLGHSLGFAGRKQTVRTGENMANQ